MNGHTPGDVVALVNRDTVIVLKVRVAGSVNQFFDLQFKLRKQKQI